METKNIAILTDFGISDNYNGVMEGVIRKINKNVNITYITPNAKNFNLYSGAYLLYTSFSYFRKGTIFLVVIDPGVGSSRRALLVKTTNYYFIGPDNGVIFPSIVKDQPSKIVQLENNKLFLSPLNYSNTFHGRDIFASAAAYLSLDVNIDIFGPEINLNTLNKISFDFKREKSIVCGKVIYIDHFGNVATSIVDNQWKYKDVIIDEKKFELKPSRTFSDGNENELLLYKNGYGFLEIGINKGNASIKLEIKEGDELCLEESIQGDFSHST
ncbi:hypothetical protein CM19_09475 [Candidatus Acidianus copahuensis]|uniref:SAM-dependent chlorinase/fluorinase n=1 Tax=Candidatus Acidianus copahuensis TaxID=1160895 RepID=A0A031LMG6_9CREN|nr:SAM-dependent chlorinase/fluorinase [Candidatus Acidianus copahuensis]EZQ03060.1 hypothetical protein CM19_09475 [Candidatus Acidianus copahuensis]